MLRVYTFDKRKKIKKMTLLNIHNGSWKFKNMFFFIKKMSSIANISKTHRIYTKHKINKMKPYYAATQRRKLEVKRTSLSKVISKNVTSGII